MKNGLIHYEFGSFGVFGALGGLGEAESITGFDDGFGFFAISDEPPELCNYFLGLGGVGAFGGLGLADSVNGLDVVVPFIFFIPSFIR